MKIRHENTVVAFSLFLALVLTSSGCDMVNSIKENFSKKDKISEEPIQEPQVTQPSQKTETITANKDNTQTKTIAKDVLAKVGDWTITKKQFEDRLNALKEVIPEFDTSNPEAKRQVLDELVRQQLLVLDAEKEGLQNQDDIKAAIEEFRRTILVREMARKLTENVTFSEDDAKAFYEEQKELLVEPIEWKVREIVVTTEDLANNILVEVLQGGDFAALAQQYSITDTASNGGDLGFINDVPFQQMAGPLLSLDPGKVSNVFKGPDGFYIIKLDEKRGGSQIPFEDIKDDIIQNQTLINQQQAIIDYVNDLQNKIEVYTNLKLLE
ncbi:MAG: peptidyl-prolyl cis-trans isomerase [Candidatus Omnitrophica bacterium]|nr:peptidyl-prolyl cis-trans isomerase [Candidatus Omnitrophota bacterium]